MQKIYATVIIIASVIIAYVIMAAFQPATNAIISSANASANFTGFESAQNALNAYPLYGWFIPGLVGLVALVITWKFPNAGG